MLNWIRKLLGREQKVTVRGDQYDRVVRASSSDSSSSSPSD